MSLRFAYVVVLSGLISGCMTAEPVAEHQRPKHWGQKIQHEANFYRISTHVYRSEQPNRLLLPELKRHDIHTVINLRHTRRRDPALIQNGLHVVHVPIHTWSIDRTDLLQVMQQIQRAEHNNQNVLIHCYHGSDRTGASIAMYRIIFQDWSIDDALAEMKHGGYGFHTIWRNIPTLFTPENIKWIREQLANPS